jgi:hypothetical protein
MEPDKPKAPGALTAHSKQTLREVLRWVEEEPTKVLEAFPGLSFAEQFSVLLFTSGPLRQDLILSSPLAGKLVPMLPEQEVHLTIKEIGLEDAMPVLALMSREQLRYLSDLEVWNRERFEAKPFLGFVKVIHQCGEDKLAEWLDAVDPELLVLFVKAYGSVTKFDVTKDPVEDTDQYTAMTYDGYYRYHPKRQEFAPLLDPVLRILKANSPERFGMIMESAYKDLPAEVEAEALRFRSARLAEKGMPDFEEACEIYRPLTDESFMEQATEVRTGIQPTEATPVLYPIRLLPADSFFRKALAALGDDPETDRIRMELASLGNKVLIAEGQEVTGVEPLKVALKKVSGTLTLALEYLEGNDVEKAASWLTRTWLHPLFRLGYSQVYKLAKEARRVRDRTGFPWIDRFHYLADSPLEETLRGLLKPRPMFFEEQGETNLAAFRDFTGMEDLRIGSARLAASEALANLFEQHLHLAPDRIKAICLEAGLGDRLDTVRWSQVLQTLWVARSLTGMPAFRPLLPDEVQQFIRKAFTGTWGADERRLDPEFTHTLVHWSMERMRPLEADTQEIIEAWIWSGAKRVEEEFKGFNPDRSIETRFIQCLCMHGQTFAEGQK